MPIEVTSNSLLIYTFVPKIPLLSPSILSHSFSFEKGGSSLVIDIGGFTIDYLAVNPGGEVDCSLARSVPIGIHNVLSDFEDSFLAKNLDAVKDTPVLLPECGRRAFATGVFEGGGRCYPCEGEVQEATSMMLNRIADTYQRIAGGALS